MTFSTSRFGEVLLCTLILASRIFRLQPNLLNWRRSILFSLEIIERLEAVLTSTEDDENHFDPRYFGKGKRWHLPETERMQQAFDEAYKQLKLKNIKLYNAGVDSLLKNIPTIKLY